MMVEYYKGEGCEWLIIISWLIDLMIMPYTELKMFTSLKKKFVLIKEGGSAFPA